MLWGIFYVDYVEVLKTFKKCLIESKWMLGNFFLYIKNIVLSIYSFRAIVYMSKTTVRWWHPSGFLKYTWYTCIVKIRWVFCKVVQKAKLRILKRTQILAQDKKLIVHVTWVNAIKSFCDSVRSNITDSRFFASNKIAGLLEVTQSFTSVMRLFYIYST